MRLASVRLDLVPSEESLEMQTERLQMQDPVHGHCQVECTEQSSATMFDIPPAGAALLASLLTGLLGLAAVRMHRKRERANRVWESRKKSYSSILARLNEASQRADFVDHGYNSGEFGHSPEVYYNSPDRPTDEQTARAAWAECRSTVDSSQLILSAKFLKRFERLLESLPKEYEDLLPPEVAARYATCLREAYSDLLSIARREFASS